MRRCAECKREIADHEDCIRDFDGKYGCSDCYKPTVTTLPQHGEKK